MNRRSLTSKFVCIICLQGVLVSCKDLPKEVEVTDRRVLTQYDNVEVFKNNYDPLIAKIQPLEWRRVNGTEFRLLNYYTGSKTEIAVGQVGAGGLLANFNRWEREYGVEEVMSDLSGLRTIPMLGRDAYMIELTGTFQRKLAGMPVKLENWSTIGVICDLGGGTLVTIKMMGPEAEVADQMDNLLDFARNLEVNPLQEVSERSLEGIKVEQIEGGY